MIFFVISKISWNQNLKTASCTESSIAPINYFVLIIPYLENWRPAWNNKIPICTMLLLRILIAKFCFICTKKLVRTYLGVQTIHINHFLHEILTTLSAMIFSRVKKICKLTFQVKIFNVEHNFNFRHWVSWKQYGQWNVCLCRLWQNERRIFSSQVIFFRENTWFEFIIYISF